MAIEKTIIIKADTKKAVTETEKLTDAIDRLVEEQKNANVQAQKTAEETKKRLEAQKKALEESRKPLNKLKTGFKGLGTAIKATGIGLLIAGVAKLTMAFNANTTVSRVFRETFETINLVFGEFVGAIVNAVQEVGKTNDSFKSLKTTATSLIDLALTPLKLVFFSIKQAIQSTQLAFKQLFNKKDREGINALKKSIEETNEQIKKTGEDAVKAGVNLVENFAGAVDDISKLGSKVSNNISKINIENTKEQAKQLVRLRDQARIAIAENELILKTKQKEAELQRQIRDNVELDILTRQKANKELGRILEESNRLQLDNANKVIELAQAEVKASGGSLQAREELIKAQLAYQDVLETTEGFVSEQDTNRVALNKELIELENSRIDATNERRLGELQFEAEQQQNEVDKIAKLQERLEQENIIALEDLERKRALFAEGTQARLDAEQEFLDRKQELDQQEIELNNQKNKAIQAANTKKTDDEKKQEQALENFKVGLAVNTLSLLGSVAKKGSALAKGVAIAQATTSTLQGINKALAETTDFTPTQSLRFANAAIVGASGFANVASILSTDDSGKSTPSLSAPTQPAVQAPSFNLVQGTGTDQIAETIQGQDQPIKAFVVSSDVTSAQELDRNAVETASL